MTGPRIRKTVGILGGMGPYATALFFQNLLDLTPAKKDWDHLHVVIDNDPTIPSRSRHFLFGEPSPLPAMIGACTRLATYPVDFIVVPCNSASHHLKQLQAAVPVPILDIFEITVNALARSCANARRVAVLGGPVTHRARSYLPYLEARGRSYVAHGEELQARVESLIERVKVDARNPSLRADLHGLLVEISRDHNVDAIILGCTEFGFLTSIPCDVPVIDSNLELARETVTLAQGPPTGDRQC
jgi:aspartate racemase